MRSFRKAFQTIPALKWAAGKFGRSRAHGLSTQLDGQNDKRISSSGCESVGERRDCSVEWKGYCRIGTGSKGHIAQLHLVCAKDERTEKGEGPS